jgi:Zn-dependent protease with chaperone function
MKYFFEQQATARKKTGWLIAYYIAAVIATVLFIYLLVMLIFAVPEVRANQKVSMWNPFIFAATILAVLALVGGCTAYKVAELAGGGSAVALMMGGREIAHTTNVAEKRLLNVVEEMAIAAGIPVPPVYVLENEKAINAFAAGYSPSEAVVTVSQGCLDYLTRDELQGVIAHEFSHILNGDMRLNVRLIAFVFGIMGLATVGMILLRSTWYVSSGSSRRDRGNQLALLGIGLYVIGIMGAFFGNLIKAAVSRQREFLADASAVQFTRNPDGIGGALLKIGGLPKGAHINNPRAPEASHMFFADAIRTSRVVGLFDTHPPLDERIHRILPNWDGNFPKVKPLAPEAFPAPLPKRDPLLAGPTLPGLPHLPIAILADDAVPTVQPVATVSPAQTAYAAGVLDALPTTVDASARDPFTARALIYGLLLSSDAAVRERQLARLRAEADARDVTETLGLAPLAAALDDTARMPAVDLAMPALRRLSPDQYATFRKQVDSLIAADNGVSLFEFVLASRLSRHLDAAFGRKPAPPAKVSGGAGGHARVVMSRLSYEGHEDPAVAQWAYDAGMRRYVGADDFPPMLPNSECTFEHLRDRLQILASAPVEAKRKLLSACAACIAADRKITPREAELYRAIGDMLGLPVPPVRVDGQEKNPSPSPPRSGEGRSQK